MIRAMLTVLLLVAAYWGTPETALAMGNCGTSAMWSAAQVPPSCDLGVAYSQCKAEEADAAAAMQARHPTKTVEKWGCPKTGTSPIYYRCYVRIKGVTENECGKFFGKGECSARPAETGWKGAGPAGIAPVCDRGCLYGGSLWGESPTGRLFEPTGALCTTDDAPAPSAGGGSDDGGGTGGETGGGDGDGGGDGGGDGDGDGGGGTGGETGGGGDGDGEGDGDGDGDGDGGGGIGPGPGPGDGDGDGEGSALPEGDMWKAPEDTMESVFDDFYEKAKKTKLVDGITNFLRIPGGGSCPTFTVSATKWWASMTYSAHCSGDFLALLQLCGYVIFAIAAYAAVRISLT